MIQASVSTLKKLKQQRITGVGVMLPASTYGLGGFDALKRLKTSGRYGLITAGGPGSGCHGPNCGRPTTTHGYLVKYGWQKQEHVMLPHPKLGGVPTSAHSYAHPKLPGQQMIVHHAGFLMHKAGDEIVKLTSLGKHGSTAGAYIKQHAVVNGVTVPSSPKAAESVPTLPVDKPSTKPPNGMEEKYIGNITKTEYIWDPKVGGYVQNTTGNVKTPIDIAIHIKPAGSNSGYSPASSMGEVTPEPYGGAKGASEKPPTMIGIKNQTAYVWNSEKNMYVGSNGKQFTKDKFQEFVNKGYFLPIDQYNQKFGTGSYKQTSTYSSPVPKGVSVQDTATGKVVNIDVPSKLSENPDFSQKQPVDRIELINQAKDLIQQYGGVKGERTQLRDYQDKAMEAWNNRIRVMLGTAHPGYWDPSELPTVSLGLSKEQLMKAAEGTGVYPEMAARAGLGPRDVNEGIKRWVRDWTSTPSGSFRAAAQEIVTNKCCSDERTKALAIEHAVTVAKLQEMFPSGKVDLARGVGSSLEAQLKYAKKIGATVNLKTLGAESWTDKPVDQWSWGNARLSASVPIENVISSHVTNPDLFSLHSSEQEFIVAQPGKQAQYKVSDIHV